MADEPASPPPEDLTKNEAKLRVEQDNRVAQVKTEAEADAAKAKPSGEGANPDG